MTVDLLRMLSLIFYIASGVFLVISVLLFIFLKVPSIIGNLSGANEKKAIEAIRRQNEDAVTHGFKKHEEESSPKVFINNSGRLVNKTDKLIGSKPLNVSSASELASVSSAATTVLSENYVGEQTTILSEEKGTTEKLSNYLFEDFKLIKEISFCSSFEIIE